MPNVTSTNIPYDEYKAIAALIADHRQVHGVRLRAVVVFGRMVADGQSRDIEVLEVVEGWSGLRFAEFGSTPALPLRGLLHLYFLTPEEFKTPRPDTLAGTSWSSADLLERVLPAYAILFEQPLGYAAEILERLEDRPLAARQSEQEPDSDPFTFVRSAMAGARVSG